MRIVRRSALLGGILLLAAAGPARAQLASDPPPLPPAGLEWVEVVPGAVEFASSHGDWTQGAHGKFVRFRPGAIAPMHRHTGDYHGVVISGTVTNPFQDGETVEMGPGTYWYVPAGAVHSTGCVSSEPCVFYTHSDGPWDLHMAEAANAGGTE